MLDVRNSSSWAEFLTCNTSAWTELVLCCLGVWPSVTILSKSSVSLSHQHTVLRLSLPGPPSVTWLVFLWDSADSRTPAWLTLPVIHYSPHTASPPTAVCTYSWEEVMMSYGDKQTKKDPSSCRGSRDMTELLSAPKSACESGYYEVKILLRLTSF